MTFKKLLLGALIFGCSASLTAEAMHRSGSFDSFDDAHYPDASGSGARAGSPGTRTPSPRSQDLVRNRSHGSLSFVSEEEWDVASNALTASPVDFGDVRPDSVFSHESRSPSVTSTTSFDEPPAPPAPSEAFLKYGARQYDMTHAPSSLSRQPARYWNAADFAAHAIRLGDLASLQHIIAEEGRDIMTTRGAAGQTPTFYLPDHWYILEYFTQTTPDLLDSVDTHVGQNMLFNETADAEKTRYIVAHAASGAHMLGLRTWCSNVSLAHIAAQDGDLDKLRYIVDAGPEGRAVLNTKTRAGETPILYAMPPWASCTRINLDLLKYAVSQAENGEKLLETGCSSEAIEACYRADVLQYLATLPNRATLFRNFPEPVRQGMAAYGEAYEELDLIRQTMSTLLPMILGLTDAQKQQWDQGETLALTAEQENTLQRKVGLSALYNVVLPMTQRIVQPLEARFFELLAPLAPKDEE